MKRAATLVILSRGDGEGPHKQSSGAVSLTIVFSGMAWPLPKVF
jgi:hypothetical protein